MKTVLLFGGSGLIGTRIQELLSKKYSILAPTHKMLDVTNYIDLKEYLERSTYDYVVYAAGLTNPDKAAQDKRLSTILNAFVPGFISDIVKKKDIPLCYFSTDAVFDGKNKDQPYREDDDVSPVNLYGETKLRGEHEVLTKSKRNCVLRLISVFTADYPHKLDYARFVVQKLKQKQNVFGISDQLVNPLYADDAVFSLEKIIQQHVSGIYHIGSTNYMTNLDFTKEIANAFDLSTGLVQPMTLSEFNKSKDEPRGKYCWLDIRKFERDFGTGTLSTIQESIERFHKNVT